MRAVSKRLLARPMIRFGAIFRIETVYIDMEEGEKMTEQCPSDEALAAFADGWPHERARIEGHLSRCAKCRDIVVFAVRTRELIDSTPPDGSFN